jgi:sulfur carrier protein
VIVVNGERCPVNTGDSIAAVLAHLDVAPDARGIAVAVDGEVVPRPLWESFRLPEDARVEVLTAMQGG